MGLIGVAIGEMVHSLGPPDTQLQVSDLAMSVTPLDSPTSVPTTGVERENPPSSPADAAGAGHDGAQQDDVPSTPPSPAATPERTGTVKYVRVLWDIENIGVTRAHGAVNTVRALRGFLAANGLDGRVSVGQSRHCFRRFSSSCMMPPLSSCMKKKNDESNATYQF